MVLTLVIDAARLCERSHDMTEVNSAVFTSIADSLFPTDSTFNVCVAQQSQCTLQM